MKLFAMLFLCSRLLTSLTQDYQLQEVHCKDDDVFKAVDVALKKYNSESLIGNQFVLYRITEVNKTEDEKISYSVKYEIKEGDCSVQSNKQWQHCDYNKAEQAATGECMATIEKRDNMKFSVDTQTCHITPPQGTGVTEEYGCHGCPSPISTDSSELDRVLRHAIQHFNSHTNHSHLFVLKEVKRATSQVVSGSHYEVTYTIEQSNCSKANFPLLTPDCKALPYGDIGECTDDAYVDVEDRIVSFSQKCNVIPGQVIVPPVTIHCVGCPSEIPVDMPYLKEALNHSITKLNAENNGTFYFKIDVVHRATTQLVAGVKYNIDFTARETTCSKESNKELTESCETNKLGESLRCTANVIVVFWKKRVETTVKCQTEGTITLVGRPPGFKPFRSVQVEKTKQGTTVCPPHTSIAPVQNEEQDSEKE